MKPLRRTLARRAALPLAVVLSTLLAACGPQDGSPAAPGTNPATPAKAAPAAVPERMAVLGTVTAVTPIVSTARPTGAGAVVGGVLGAAVGNQIGDGNGRKIATVLGAAGGAKVGHEVEKRRSSEVTGYRVDVALDGGGTRQFTLASSAGFSTGQRVRVIDGQLQPA